MKHRNRIAKKLAIVAGILLLISGTTGAAVWISIAKFILTRVSNAEVIKDILTAAVFIASLGGIAVIAGGILIGQHRTFLGKLLIMLGAGAGLLSLLFHIYLSVFTQNFAVSSFTSLSAVGVILSILARIVAK